MSSNGQIAPHDERTRWLDQMLEGKPDEIKARVLNIIIKYDIDPENEFFIVFVALGQLQVLVEDSPKEWQHLFSGFEGELNKWAETNTETLAQLTRKTETMEALASNSERLSSILTGLTEACNALIDQLQKSNGISINSLEQLQTSETELKNLLNSTNQKLSELNSQVTALNQSSNQKPNAVGAHQPSTRAWTWKDSLLFVWLSVLLAGMAMLYVQGTDTSQRVQWLLEKGNRRDCATGIKSPDNPMCQSYQN